MKCTRGHPDQKAAEEVSFLRTDPLFLEMQRLARPVILADAQRDSRFQGWGHTKYVRGWLGVLLIALGETIGMLTIDSELPNAFTEIRDVQISMVFANFAAMTILDVLGREARETKVR